MFQQRQDSGMPKGDNSVRHSPELDRQAELKQVLHAKLLENPKERAPTAVRATLNGNVKQQVFRSLTTIYVPHNLLKDLSIRSKVFHAHGQRRYALIEGPTNSAKAPEAILVNQLCKYRSSI
ncbi:hypothetical protein BGW42_001363 [Actinomortierella wolfii]|nr:hypothetical protein BGW42_001363 [Actinomortierella wolfii]